MQFLRRHKTRRLTGYALLLIALFLQVQTAFACNLMEGKVQAICCCDTQMEKGCSSGGGCESNASVAQGDCCQIVVSTPTAESATSAMVAKAILDRSDIPQPDSSHASLPMIPGTPPSTRPVIAAIGSNPTPWLAGKNTYLVTLRIRV
ncbi:MAG: hypothetical protein ACC641_00355 [Acidiferrobacterales bacterium]